MRPGTSVHIGYYVHHHGAGHLARARAIAASCDGRITLLGTGLGAGPDRIDLPDDRLDQAFSGQDGAARPDWLHYAPLHHEGVQQRHAAIAVWIAASRPALMVVDVSVEIACLARLCGVPVIYVRLPGSRSDPPHVGVFRDAWHLLAPFPQTLERPDTPDWIKARTLHAGFITEPVMPGGQGGRRVVVMCGRGGTDIAASDIAAAAAATPGWRWQVLGGGLTFDNPPENLSDLGWAPEPARYLSADTVLVGGAGDGTVGLAASIGCHFICIPQARPYGEQAETAAALKLAGAAHVFARWPAPADWQRLLRGDAEDRRPRLAALHDPRAAARAASFLLQQAAQLSWPPDARR